MIGTDSLWFASIRGREDSEELGLWRLCVQNPPSGTVDRGLKRQGLGCLSAWDQGGEAYLAAMAEPADCAQQPIFWLSGK